MTAIADNASPNEKPAVSAASLRAPLRGEVYPITVTTSSKTFNVPAAWKGRLVRLCAHGADVLCQVSADASNVAVSTIASLATEANNPIDLTPPNAGCYPVFQSSFLDVPFPLGAVTFALVGSAACVARMHLSET